MGEHREELVFVSVCLEQRFCRLLTFGDIAGNRRCADHLLLAVEDGRDLERHVDHCVVFAPADGFDLLDDLSPADVCEHRRFFVDSLRWDEKRQGLPHRFRGGVAEQPFCTGIPTGDDVVEILADDRIVRRFDDR